MIRPNWNIFRAKFEDARSNFEWFCYVLFCREVKKSHGIFRYKNQSAIETNTISKGAGVIGWQARFYDGKLGDHKPQLVAMLEKAKRDYPNITKLVFYTNVEWGQDKGKEPKGKKEVEEKSKALGIELDWRTGSYFESPFVTVENDVIARHFFTYEKSAYDMMEEQKRHTENILDQIQTYIDYGSQRIEIDRSKELESITAASERVLILSGVAGVGKTALIKSLFAQAKNKIPFYVFKATEFEMRSIREFFAGYTIQDFLNAHEEDDEKIIVIDSSEKLLDLKNTDPFKEFLSVVLKANWKIVFTTRDNYLENLNIDFFEIYQIAPMNVNVRNVNSEELSAIADQYAFALPKDERLLELIRNSFYLSEYLKHCKEGLQTSYVDFKATLWVRTVHKSRPAREQCFLKMAFTRANEGQFYVNPDCESRILDDELRRDGIIGYESPHGYFITHDIYEEWALEKIVETEFRKKENIESFFSAIHSSLPVRHAFRHWLSEKILSDNAEMKTFVEEVTRNTTVEAFWRDEVLVSVLLSDYSDAFVGVFKEDLLARDQQLLRRLTFLLRLACKEVDDDFFRGLGIKNLNLSTLKYVLTRPKGTGWSSLIKFVFENLGEIGVQNINFVLPLVHDWSTKFKAGETTRLAGLIALQFYQWTIKKDVHFSRDDTKDELLQTIFYCSSEIKNELEGILKEVLKNKWKQHRDPYYDLSKGILTKIEGISVSQVLPSLVLELADLFWSLTPKEDQFYSHAGIGVEQYFNMEEEYLAYFPASSFQTPIYWLLQTALRETIDFILRFTNKSVEYFAKTDFAKYEVKEVEVYVEKEKPMKQFISNRLWCMYRGTQVCPHAIESMHMALEKYFLERAKNADSQTLESWLLYLLKNSRSASISGVVASIVMAFPEKTFNAAQVLFRTKDLFFYDTSRLVLDQGHKSTLLMLKNGFPSNVKHEIHQNERLEACDAKHRTRTLEHAFLNYQFFRGEGTDEKESERRQGILWGILDEYYKKIPDSPQDAESENTWRLYLARMDRRQMDPISEQTADGYLIHLNPDIEPKLKEYSEKALEKSSRSMKHISLKLWANYRLSNDEKYKEYKQYEDNPKQALREVDEIIRELGRTKGGGSTGRGDLTHDGFYLLNHSIPVEVCSALVRDHADKLSKEEVSFCADIILESASSASKGNLRYEATDGARAAISVLPSLLGRCPKETGRIKEILLLGLFNNYPIDMAGTRFNAFPVTAIHKLWNSNHEDAQSILIGFLFLKPRYNALREQMRQEKRERKEYNLEENEMIERFLKENKRILRKVAENKVAMEDVDDIEVIDLHTLQTAFQLVPLKTTKDEHKSLVRKIISIFADGLVRDGREEKIDYEVRQGFLEKLAYFVLSSPREDIQGLVKPFLDRFNASEVFSDLFKEFISAEDYLNSYENFWEVWNQFKEKVFGLCQEGDGYWYVDEIVKSYLFAQNHWKGTASEWHTLKEENRRFFQEISEGIGHCPSTLYSVSKLLTGIGSPYLNDGIPWLSHMLKHNSYPAEKKLETNTIYYLETALRKYVYRNREQIKRALELKKSVLVILDFLVERGSVVGYMLRENLL